MTTLREAKKFLDKLELPSVNTYTLDDWRQGRTHKLSPAAQQRHAEVWAQVRETITDFEGDTNDNP